MLRLLVHLHPMPLIDPYLLQSQGMSYNGRIGALFLLESQYVALEANGYDVDSPSHDLTKDIRECYLNIDRDVCMCISLAVSSLPGTNFALSLDTYDLVNDSTSACLSLFDRADEGHANFLPIE